MLNTTVAPPATLTFPAVIETLPGRSLDHGLRCRIYHEAGHCDAWTWLNLDSAPPGVLHWGAATTMEIGHHTHDLLLLGLLDDIRPPLSSMLPETLCPIPGVLRQTTRLIDSLQNEPLRDFVTRALLTEEPLHGFWTSPASRRDHHAYPGGLAEHSLEVATMLATASGLPAVDRELGIVFALLHDFGKLWCYEPITFDAIDPRMHEEFGLSQLQDALSHLSREDERLGALMRELLGGPRSSRPSRYPLAIGRIVRAFDQMSCEKTRRAGTESLTTSEWVIPF